jgi:hypothetical protein
MCCESLEKRIYVHNVEYLSAHDRHHYRLEKVTVHFATDIAHQFCSDLRAYAAMPCLYNTYALPGSRNLFCTKS